MEKTSDKVTKDKAEMDKVYLAVVSATAIIDRNHFMLLMFLQ